MLPSARARIRASAAICGALVLSAGLAACGTSTDSSSASADALTISTAYKPSTFDPHSGSGVGFQTIFPAYDTLLHVNDDGELEPWLATKWNFVDPTTLELKLRADVTFTDGEAFNAAAVKANLEYARDIPEGTSYQGYLKNITKVNVVDPTTVRIVLAQANPGLPYDLSQIPGEMVSPKALKNPDGLASKPAGSGPYVLDAGQTRSGQRYVWTRNKDYWAADKKLFPYDKITYVSNTDPTAARNAARARTVDVLSVNAGDSVSGFKTVKSLSGDNAGFSGIWLDVAGKTQPALRDVRVRQAMNYAIDRKTIASNVFEGAATAVPAVPVTEDSSAYSPELANKYPYDPAKARKLLAEAGYKDGFSIKMLATQNGENYGQAIAGYLRKVGINAKISSYSGPELPQQLQSGTYGAGLILSRPTGETGQDFGGLFTSDAFFNVAKTSDPKIDSLLKKAAAETDEKTRNGVYQKLATYAADQAWFAGTLMQQTTTAYDPGAVKVTTPPYGEIWLYNYHLPS